MLLAGDAAGFVDPMTGDGLRLAVRGGMLAAEVALAMLEQPHLRGHVRLSHMRAAEFGRKLRLNRLLRGLIDRPAGLRAGGLAARVAPAVIRRLVVMAGDVGIASRHVRVPAGARVMNTWTAGLAAVAVPMVLESWRSRSNERRLLASGAIEPAGDVYQDDGGRVSAVVRADGRRGLGARWAHGRLARGRRGHLRPWEGAQVLGHRGPRAALVLSCPGAHLAPKWFAAAHIAG